MSVPAGLWTWQQLAEHTELWVTLWFIPSLFLSLRGGGSQPAPRLVRGLGAPPVRAAGGIVGVHTRNCKVGREVSCR